MTFDEILATRKRMEAEYRQMPRLPTVYFGQYFYLVPAEHSKGQVQFDTFGGSKPVKGGELIPMADVDQFVREWIKLRPECLQEPQGEGKL